MRGGEEGGTGEGRYTLDQGQCVARRVHVQAQKSRIRVTSLHAINGRPFLESGRSKAARGTPAHTSHNSTINLLYVTSCGGHLARRFLGVPGIPWVRVGVRQVCIDTAVASCKTAKHKQYAVPFLSRQIPRTVPRTLPMVL